MVQREGTHCVWRSVVEQPASEQGALIGNIMSNGAEVGTSELAGRALTPSRNDGVVRNGTADTSTVTYFIEHDKPETNPPSAQTARDELGTDSLPQSRESKVISELDSTDASRTGTQSGQPSPLTPYARSGEFEGAASGMTARGSWRGYMSPEQALAEGWRDDGVE